MTYYKSSADYFPELVDITSSPTTVYLRKNVREVEIEDVITGEKRTEFQYDEAKITKDEYINLLHEELETSNEALQELILSLEG